MLARRMLPRQPRRLRLRLRSSTSTLCLRALATSRAADVAPVSGAGVRACVLAILEQHKTLLRALDDATYTFASPLLQASVGQHTRHSLDHLRKPVEALLTADAARADVLIRYDVRARNTVIEHNRVAAIDQIETLQGSVRALDDAALQQRLRAAFMLSADGREVALESNLSRELAFAVHHCIHHNALSKVLLRHHFPDVAVPQDFGMAPSTTNFLRTAATS